MGRKDRIKPRTRKSLKKKCHGNRFTKKEAEEQLLEVNTPNDTSLETDVVSSSSNTADGSIIESVSKRKIVDILTDDTPNKNDQRMTGYRLMDVEILSSDVIEILSCPECKRSGLTLHENFAAKKGFASNLELKCKCGFLKSFCTSKPCITRGVFR